MRAGSLFVYRIIRGELIVFVVFVVVVSAVVVVVVVSAVVVVVRPCGHSPTAAGLKTLFNNVYSGLKQTCIQTTMLLLRRLLRLSRKQMRPWKQQQWQQLQ